MKYKTIDTSTIEGVKQAERLQASGWTQYYVGLFIIKFRKA